MKKNNMLLIYFLSFIYLEFFYRVLLYDKIFRFTNINMILFVLFLAFVFFTISKLFCKKANKIIFFVLMFLVCLWFAAQYVVKGFLDFYISFSVLQIADQVGSFLGKALMEIGKRLPGIVFLYLPFILCAIFNKKINYERHNCKESFAYLLLCLCSYVVYFCSLNIRKNEEYSAYVLYHEINNPALNVEKVGVLNTFCTDIYRVIFGFDSKIKIMPKKKTKVNKTKYEYNNLNIDFDGLIANSDDDTVKDMSEYFKNESGTLKNEYTGLFKGKNVIIFMAESFNEVALKKEIMPNLYEMANSSFVFDNYYTPTICSTIGGEFQELTGLYANFSSLPKFRDGENYFPMGFATMFKNAGYNTYAFHDNTYTFQDRNVYLKTLGIDNFKACANGLETVINCNQWPPSDVEMIDATYKDYINSEEPFMVFYASVSGHASYNWDNAMAAKHKDEIKKLKLGYSEPVEAYLAAQMELDDAIGNLINHLKEAGKLDDTVIVLVGDHYPYELSTKQMNEMADYKKDGVIEINHSRLIIYNSEQETIHIDKVGSQIDVMPTIYNLFGLPYDSRLFIGHDILSTEPGLAMFADNSWVSDKGKYFATKNKYVSNNKIKGKKYSKKMNSDVKTRIAMSKYIMDTDYYRLIWDYVKEDVNNEKQPK